MQVGDAFINDKVLMLSDNGKYVLGVPYVDKASVELKILEHTRGEKINIIHFKRRKHHMRRQGHRQNLSKD